MNRLVLIGNGYDLANGLKSSYEDFLIDYIKSSIGEALNSKRSSYSDDLIEIFINNTGEYEGGELESIHSIESILHNDRLTYIQNPVYKRFKSFNENTIFEYGYDPETSITLSINSHLLQKLFENKNWTDIESSFYNEILKVYNDKGAEDKSILLRTLNEDFVKIKNLMIRYLTKIDITKQIDYRIKRIYKKIQTDLTEIEFNDYFSNKSERKLEKLLFLNFNYTNQINSHVKELVSLKHEVVPIHGNLKVQDSIIFGYGDNSRTDYKKLRAANVSQYFEHDKTYKYSSNQNMRIVNRFIKEKEYDLFVLGHSLGTSDKVLLKRIMDNKNCKAIRLFHRRRLERFNSKLISLNQHYNNIENLMDIIVPYDIDDNLNSVV